MARSIPSGKDRFLRNKIFTVLNKNKASVDIALKVLSQCHAHVSDRKLIESIAKNCGWKLSGFLSDEYLELYYDLKHGQQNVGFLSKGWDDPGFRLGQIVEVPKWKLTDMKEHMYALLKFFATQGVAITVEENETAVELQMEYVIYSEGFNRRVAEHAFHSLNACAEKVQDLIG